ncbi:MAG: bifunctional 4-hydroxy-2-oxoglutarate aldolase/2-dehydro-3-deoxy-phosphogluconate aldolase [Flammeovirgaceae bacterium]|nr:bifunctional 4-hydroxy-2-oxoglutarate aldolase/2-dehydro-3-deoxy-phosphogluconate aldolase [Flammeovirgaceae bacterium]
MAKFSRIEVINKMWDTGLVPLFYHNELQVVKNVVKACYDGGARVFEFTSRGDFAFEIFRDLSKYALVELPGMALGVGSVTDAAMASNYIQLGANFIITPVLREDIAVVCNRTKTLWSPGCGTLTEIAKAEELGCAMVKLFPAEIYGPAFIKAVKGPQPWTEIMPTGGVSPTEESLKSWLDAGARCVGMGSQLISKEIIKTGDYTLLENKTRFAINTIKSLKSVVK